TNDHAPTVTWESTADAAEYDLLIATDSGLSTPVQAYAALTTTSQPLSALSDGTYYAGVTATDLAGNTTPAFNEPASFTIDTTPPVAPEFDLDEASDTPPLGDGQTTFETVRLVGTTEPAATVTLIETGELTTAD